MDTNTAATHFKLDASQAALLGAINASLGVKVDVLERNVETLSARIQDVSTKQNSADARMDAMESELRQVRLLAVGGGSAASVAGASGFAPSAQSTACSGGRSGFDNDYLLPVNRRRIIFLGGYPKDTLKSEVEAHLRSVVAGPSENSIEDLWGCGKLCSAGKIRFTSSDGMWRFIKAHKGERLKFNSGGLASDIWFSIDKTESERKISSRTSKGIHKIREKLVTASILEANAPKNSVDGDFQKGSVWIRLGGRTTRILERIPDSDTFQFRIVDSYQNEVAGDMTEVLAAVNE